MRSLSLSKLASSKLVSIGCTLFVAIAIPFTANRYRCELDNQKAAAYVKQGNALYAQGKQDDAITAYRQALKVNPKSAYAYNKLGLALQVEGKLDEAIAVYHQAIKFHPKDAWVYGSLGKVLGDQGKLAEAIAAYRKAIQLNPNFASVYNNLGNELYEQGKLEEAIAAYHKAIQLNPKFTYAYNNLGNALSDQGKLDEAIAALRNSIQLDPKNAIVYNNLGYVLQQQDKLEEAIGAFTQAVVLNPDFDSPKFYLNEAQRLLTIRQNPQLSVVPERIPSLKAEPSVSLKRSVVRIILSGASDSHIGTGWVVKRQGKKAWIVTNRHVVIDTKNKPSKPQKIEVEFYSQPLPGQFRKRQLAQIAQTTSVNDQLDLALLEVNSIPKDIHPLPLSSTPVSPYTPIRTIGNPNTTGDWSVAMGEVLDKTDQELQLSAVSAPGNSGAPVLDQKNHVAGVVWGRRSQTADKFGPAMAFPIELVTQQLHSWGIS